MTRAESRFLYESNAIEGEYGHEAFEDAYHAWNEAKVYQTGLTIPNILKIHALLMLRLNPRIAGKIRDCDVFVGNRRCPPHYQVMAMLEEWTELYDNAKTFEKIKEAHIAFEKIHPFEDGNGRTGRIIMNVQLTRRGDDPMIFWDSTKQDYYSWFRE